MGGGGGGILGGGGAGGLLGGVVGSIFGGSQDQGLASSDITANIARGSAARNQQTIAGMLPQQQQFGQQLASQAMGNQPSITNAMLKSANDRNLSQQLAATQANRSVNPALAQRQFLQGAAQQGQQTAQAAGIQGLQEHQANQGAFQNYLNSIYGAENGSIGGATQASGNLAAAEQGNQSRGDRLAGGLLNAAGSAFMPKSPGQPNAFAHGGQVSAHGPQSIIGQHMHNMRSGGHVPGQAVVSGDSSKNDIVPAMLSPGEVVIPRSIMNGKNPAQAAAKFVKAVMAKKGRK